MKVCFKCKKEKPLSDFYKHKKMSDGHLNKCKECTKEDVKKREIELKKDPIWVEKERERSREKYHRLNYVGKYKPTKEQKKEIMDRYINKYPEKNKAKSICSNLKPEINGNHLHHWSYNEGHYKDVIELTKDMHYFTHRYINYDQERKMYRCSIDTYRFKSGELLDTKERHLSFIDDLIEYCK